jgi:uncharacterized protein (TIGR02265 family)
MLPRFDDVASDGKFVDPPWEAPLSVERALQAIPRGATISGMFFVALVQGAQQRNVSLPFSESRYLPFKFYSLHEFAPLLVDGAQQFHPALPLRQGLRRIGKVGPKALLSSTLGKVTLGVAAGVHEAVTAFAKTYSLNVKPSHCEVVRQSERTVVVRLEVPYFIDSHHVGAFEGILEYAGVKGSVRIAKESETRAELLLEWR